MALPPSLSNTVPGRYNSASLEVEEVVFDRPCIFLAAAVGNYGASDFYIWIEDRADNGLAASWPCFPPIKVIPGDVRSIDWSLAPRSMGRGIYICASTSPTVRTLVASNDAYLELAYAII